MQGSCKCWRIFFFLEHKRGSEKPSHGSDTGSIVYSTGEEININEEYAKMKGFKDGWEQTVNSLDERTMRLALQST